MALIECKECHKQISDSASACPHCGHPRVWYMQKININPAFRSLAYIVVGISLLVFVIIGVAQIFMDRESAALVTERLNPLKSSDTFLDSQSAVLEPTRRIAYSFSPDRHGYARAKVVETFGKNIEFEVRKEGRRIYESGVSQGKAEGVFEVHPGKYNIIAINDNILESKNVEISLTVDYR